LSRDAHCHFDPFLWAELSRSGFYGLSLPQYRGGEAISLAEQVEVCVGLAAGSQDLPFTVSAMVQAFIATDLLLKFGNERQIEKYLGPISRGEKIAAVSNSESTGGTDVLSLKSEIIEAQGSYRLKLNKYCATNLSEASLVFASAWDKTSNEKPLLDVFIIELSKSDQKNLIPLLSGFKTGLAGSVQLEADFDSLESIRLGSRGSGFNILQHVYNLERLFLPSIIMGTLEGLIPQSFQYASSRTSKGNPLASYQYIQEKIFSLFSVKESLEGILMKILYGPNRAENSTDLIRHSLTLSALKVLSSDEGLSAAIRFFELFGFSGYVSNHLASKFVRDMLAFKSFGGTEELHKTAFFREFQKEFQNEK
jgi:alkylation response protein AidB-like acyl-CoA dehydrogenase